MAFVIRSMNGMHRLDDAWNISLRLTIFLPQELGKGLVTGYIRGLAFYPKAGS